MRCKESKTSKSKGFRVLGFRGLGSYREYIGIGIMEKKMETTGIIGVM